MRAAEVERRRYPMRAILRTGFGGPEVLVIREIPEPEPKDGHAVIAGQFLIKDLALLGISLRTLGEAWKASER